MVWLPYRMMPHEKADPRRLLVEWAQKIGMEAEGLTRTLEHFDGFARIDEDVHRSVSAYDKYYRDPPTSLVELSHLPCYAVKMRPETLAPRAVCAPMCAAASCATTAV